MFFTQKNIVGASVIALVVLLTGIFFLDLKAVSGTTQPSTPVTFQIDAGDGFRYIASHLYGDHLIRSQLAFEMFALIDGRAFSIRPGLYRLNQSMDVATVLANITGSSAGISKHCRY